VGEPRSLTKEILPVIAPHFMGSVVPCTDRVVPVTPEHELGVVSSRPRRAEMSAVEPASGVPSTVLIACSFCFPVSINGMYCMLV